MDQTNHYRKLERMYLNANINSRFYESTQIKIDNASAEIKLTIDDKTFTH